MSTNWMMEAGFRKSVFDDLTDVGQPIPATEKINIVCPHCSYHTAWRRADDWINCGWCLEFVGNGADRRKAEADRNSQILEIKKAIATAETQGVNLKNKIAVTVKRCSDRDKRLYQSWEFLPNEDHARMLAGIQDLIKPKVDEEYYAAIDF